MIHHRTQQDFPFMPSLPFYPLFRQISKAAAQRMRERESEVRGGERIFEIEFTDMDLNVYTKRDEMIHKIEKEGLAPKPSTNRLRAL